MSSSSIAAATPADRDRYLDLLRVTAIGTVVIGHWLMAVVVVKNGRPDVTNVLTLVPDAQVMTWLFQVMPVFFFVGGFGHAKALASLARRGGSYADFVRSRTARLLRPTAVFLGVWVLVALALDVTHQRTGLPAMALSTVVQPLWFIGVYLGVVALAPAIWSR